MRALVKTAPGPGNVELREVPEPKVGPREVLVKIAAAGICGSDVLILQDELKIYRPPVILGHNNAGTVAAVGGEVTDWAPGDRVGIDMNVGACGQCDYCRSQREYLCPGRAGLGYGIDGGMAEYLSVGQQWLVRVPEGVRLEEAAAMDFANAAHGVIDRAGVRFGESLLIFGPGFQGLAMLQVARLIGASPIIMVGRARHEQRLELARTLGVDHVLVSDRTDVPTAVREIMGGRGIEVALETTGAVSALSQAIASLRRGGRLAMIGSLPTDAVVDMHSVVYDELLLTPIRGYNRANVQFFMAALAAGQLNVASFIECFPLEQWEQAFAARRERRVIEPVFVP